MLLAVVGILGASLATLHAISKVIGAQLLFRQLLWGTGGLLVLWLMSRIHPNFYERVAVAFYGLSLAALVAVLFFGEVRSGTRGWFAFGPITLQPSEFARVGTILMVAAWLGRRRGRALGPGERSVISAIVGAAVLLVLLQPDLGVALTYLPVLAAGLWIGGIPNRAWVAVTLAGLALCIVAWHTMLEPYQKERVFTVLNPDRDPYGYGYQVRQSKIAVGSGRVAGHGLGRGSQSLLRFLPAQHTDFVFAAWAEATGFIGTTGLLAAYALLIGRIGLAAITAESRHGLILGVLVASWLAFQVVINLGMVLGWLPTTGVTLPLFSYGGSSLLSTFAALGVVQSVWRHRLVNQ
jgi:rod shape determining protein RodA